MFAYERDPGIACGEAEFSDIARILGGPVFLERPPLPYPPEARSAGSIDPQPRSTSVAHRDVAPPSSQPGLVRRLRESLGMEERGPTDAESFDDIARRGDGVALVSLVFLPDDDHQTGALTRRRRDVALELDAALARVVRDPRTDGSVQVAVEVLGPGDPFIRHRGVRPAGMLREPDLPRIPVENFDLPDSFDVLTRQIQRNTTSMRTRGGNVVSSHIVFFATMAPLPTRESVARFEELLTQARITWIHFGPESEMIPEEFERRGAYLLTDEPDIVNTALYYSSDIYARALPIVATVLPEVPDVGGGPDAWDSDTGHDWLDLFEYPTQPLPAGSDPAWGVPRAGQEPTLSFDLPTRPLQQDLGS
jgi:hypothetical protein